jgi:hypothetical protein
MKRLDYVDPSRDDDPQPIQLKEQGKKVIVTDFALSHWLAQTFKIELTELSHLKPQHLTSAAYDEIKVILKDY